MDREDWDNEKRRAEMYAAIETCERPGCGGVLADGSCPKCGLYHDPGNACSDCGRAGWHLDDCPMIEEGESAVQDEDEDEDDPEDDPDGLLAAAENLHEILAAVFPYALSRAEDMYDAMKECQAGQCACATQPLDETCTAFYEKAAAAVERARIALGLK